MTGSRARPSTAPSGSEIIGVGVDIVSVVRFSRSASQEGFLRHVLADEEPRDSLRDSAARFAIKEAVLKCLGTGAWQDGTDFPDVVVGLRRDQVSVRLQGAAATIAGPVTVHSSLTQAGDRLIATAIVSHSEEALS